MSSSTQTQEDRFWSKVSKGESCWLWTAGIHTTGYGIFGVASGRWMYAHRFAYQLHSGPIPSRLQVDHLCHGWDEDCKGGSSCPHRRCVNPDHLEAVTHQVNTLRGRGPAAVAAKRTHCPQGHPYDAANTLVESSGARRCRTCTGAREARRRKAQPPRLRMSVPPPVIRLLAAHFPGEKPADVLVRATRALALREGLLDEDAAS